MTKKLKKNFFLGQKEDGVASQGNRKRGRFCRFQRAGQAEFFLGFIQKKLVISFFFFRKSATQIF